MSDNVLRLFPQSGLCSRLRAIVGAMAQAEAEDRPLEVAWQWRLGAELPTLMPVALSELWDVPFRTAAFPVAEPGETAWLVSCHLEPFKEYIPDGEFQWQFRRLMPTLELVARVRRMAEVMPSSPVVGVHIRASEPHATMVGLSWFQQRMRQFRERWPDLVFYLATDAPSVSQKIHDEFGPSVIEQIKSYRYDRNGAFAHAADLYVLIDHCDYVVGTNNSASSQLVALVRGATYKGPSHQPSGVSGGRYEDAWNPGEPVFGG